MHAPASMRAYMQMRYAFIELRHKQAYELGGQKFRPNESHENCHVNYR